MRIILISSDVAHIEFFKEWHFLKCHFMSGLWGYFLTAVFLNYSVATPLIFLNNNVFRQTVSKNLLILFKVWFVGDRISTYISRNNKLTKA